LLPVTDQQAQHQENYPRVKPFPHLNSAELRNSAFLL
jgi:hypothetical protein